MSDLVDRGLLYARTVRQLRPSQIAHRIRLRALKLALGQAPRPFARRWQVAVPSHAGWPTGYATIDERLAEGFPAPEKNVEHVFDFVGEQRSLGSTPDWDMADASQLWRYHLHYFEWAWSFVAHPDREWASEQFLRLWRSWRTSTVFGRWDAWSPYVVSLRAWVLAGVYAPLVRGSSDEGSFLRDLALHAGFVRANLEFDVGGNHVVKNLKALCGLGVFLGDDRMVATASAHLAEQLTVQVLDDGGHYERSPSYHCQVLGDLIDVAALLRASGRPPVRGLDDAIIKMQRWLGTMLLPDGDVPLFNDCTLVGIDRLALLEPAARPSEPLTVLQPSGYVVARPSERIHLVADVGPPCPAELPAHAHADCLSFELVIDGERFIVDTGTSTYSPGARRMFERGTAAHNTVEVDRENQTEVWGAFRAARRAKPTMGVASSGAGSIDFAASHEGYCRLEGRPVHQRSWHCAETGIDIVDQIEGEGVHHAVARLHLAPGHKVEREDSHRAVSTQAVISTTESLQILATDVANRHGALHETMLLTTEAKGHLPLRLETRIRIHEDL